MDPPDPLCGSGVGGLSLRLLCKTGQKPAQKGSKNDPFWGVPHPKKGFARARGAFSDDIFPEKYVIGWENRVSPAAAAAGDRPSTDSSGFQRARTPKSIKKSIKKASF